MDISAARDALTSVYSLVQAGQIPPIRIGKSRRILKEQLIEWLKTHMVQPK